MARCHCELHPGPHHDLPVSTGKSRGRAQCHSEGLAPAGVPLQALVAGRGVSVALQLEGMGKA